MTREAFAKMILGIEADRGPFADEKKAIWWTAVRDLPDRLVQDAAQRMLEECPYPQLTIAHLMERCRVSASEAEAELETGALEAWKEVMAAAWCRLDEVWSVMRATGDEGEPLARRRESLVRGFDYPTEAALKAIGGGDVLRALDALSGIAGKELQFARRDFVKAWCAYRIHSDRLEREEEENLERMLRGETVRAYLERTKREPALPAPVPEKISGPAKVPVKASSASANGKGERALVTVPSGE